MADEKKKGASKFLKIVAGLVLVAIIVVVVILLVPTNKSGLVEELYAQEETILLMDNKSSNSYSTFSNRMSDNARLRVYTQELKDVKEISKSMYDVVNYYNDIVKYAQNNKVLKNNNGKIKSALENINKTTKTLNKIIDDAVSLTETKETYLRNAWIEYRRNLSIWTKNYAQVCVGLSNIANGCFDNSLTVNVATKTNLKVISAYMTVISERMSNLVETDKASVDVSQFSYDYHGIIEKLKFFSDSYILKDTSSKNYFYDDALVTKYQAISNCTKKISFKDLIETINYYGTFVSSDTKDADRLTTEKYLGGN